MNRAQVIAKLKSVETDLRAHGVASLYLFGSYARDEARPESDLDVFVDAAGKEFFKFENYLGAYETLQEAFPGIEVGYTTRQGLSKYIRPEVEQQAIRIF